MGKLDGFHAVVWPVSRPLHHCLFPWPPVSAHCQTPPSWSWCPVTLPTKAKSACCHTEGLRNNEADSQGDSSAPNGFSKDTLNLWKYSMHRINTPNPSKNRNNTKCGDQCYRKLELYSPCDIWFCKIFPYRKYYFTNNKTQKQNPNKKKTTKYFFQKSMCKDDLL